MHSVQVTKAHWEQMRSHVEGIAPLEACGLLAGNANESRKVYPIANSLQSPTRFKMAEAEMVAGMHSILEEGWEILAIYHSHPEGPAVPSPTDISEATFLESVQLIWGQVDGHWRARAYMYKANKSVEEISISIV